MLSKSEMTRQKAPAPSRGTSKESDGRAAGTGFGDSKYSPVTEIAFEPENAPAEKVLIKYEGMTSFAEKASSSAWGKGMTGSGRKRHLRPFLRDIRAADRVGTLPV